MLGKRNRIDKSYYGYLFISPFFISFLFFDMSSIVYTFSLSLHKWDGFTDPVFIGMANYARLIRDHMFIQTIGNTLIIWILSIVPQLTIALLTALLLNEKFIRGKHFFRAVFYFPHIITPVTLGVMFSLMFDWQTGSVNKVLLFLGWVNEPVYWFGDPWLSRLIVASVICWQYFGLNMLIFIAGLQSIPLELYEAAELDGATRPQIARYITLPLLRPVFLFTLITSVIGGLKLFDAPLMLGDGPRNATRTMSMFLYQTSFLQFDYSYGATIAYGIFVIIIFFTLITMGLTRILKREGQGV
ncbi:sugar ABC transporter permease [Paenibacillus sp. CC-CFT747]|nr:sugar ABC transporter permease [Paenibacillus sp. CC-CFT747]